MWYVIAIVITVFVCTLVSTIIYGLKIQKIEATCVRVEAEFRVANAALEHWHDEADKQKSEAEFWRDVADDKASENQDLDYYLEVTELERQDALMNLEMVLEEIPSKVRYVKFEISPEGLRLKTKEKV